MGFGLEKIKEKTLSRLNLPPDIGLGSPGVDTEQGMDCLESQLLSGKKGVLFALSASVHHPPPSHASTPPLLFTELLGMCVQASQAREKDL